MPNVETILASFPNQKKKWCVRPGLFSVKEVKEVDIG
jgi:hypothetical protein